VRPLLPKEPDWQLTNLCRARLQRLRKNSISFVILSEAKNLAWFKSSPQGDSSAKSAPQNDSKMFFSAACSAVPEMRKMNSALAAGLLGVELSNGI
jgi:hypothetical protein